jgi:SAM-dependent methyltransferase
MPQKPPEGQKETGFASPRFRSGIRYRGAGLQQGRSWNRTARLTEPCRLTKGVLQDRWLPPSVPRRLIMKRDDIPLSQELAKVRSVWHTLGEEDPLWAVATRDDRRSRNWQLDEFLKTGEQDVATYRALLKNRAGAPDHFGSVLDFGCGVGRLSRVWLRHADRVVGVDISAPMLEQGRKILGDEPRMTFLLNESGDLAACQNAQFDLVFSHICLMHMPWTLARGYLCEFARVCRPGGWVAFQLPSRRCQTWAFRKSQIRRALIDSLPFGLGTAWRKWKHGTTVVFEVNCTPLEEVRRVAESVGLRLCHAEPSQDGGEDTEGYIYVFEKERRSPAKS